MKEVRSPYIIAHFFQYKTVAMQKSLWNWLEAGIYWKIENLQMILISLFSNKFFQYNTYGLKRFAF